MEHISKNQEETYQIAADIAVTLRGGDVLALSGDLGSGKTTFTQGLAKALGIDRQITSPTFVLMKEYKMEGGNGKAKRVIHVDAYRLSGKEDAETIGLRELLCREDIITVIEWPERIKAILPKKTQWILFEYIDENRRRINLIK